MTRVPLPLVGGPAPERADAARNREALLRATQRLIDSCGVDAVTMDAVAQAAGVGKGTLFRRFTSRAGLMAAVLNFREQEFQRRVLSGPPPLGPGAPPMDRLLAFGHQRLVYSLEAARLIEAAGRVGRASGAGAFSTLHVAHLLGELDVTGDRRFLASALIAPLQDVVLDDPGIAEGFPVEQFEASWADLVHRVVTGRPLPT